MNRPYYAPHNAPHLINRAPSVVGKSPPPLLNSSTYKSHKDNFISYLVASAAMDIVPRGFLLPHNKADFGLKATASDSKATPFDSKAIPFDSKATASDSKATLFDSKAIPFNLKATASHSEAMTYIFRITQEEINNE
jgi:hypothetical protein